MGQGRSRGEVTLGAFVLAASGALASACGSTVITDLGLGGGGNAGAGTSAGNPTSTGSLGSSTGSGTPSSSGSGVSTGSAATSGASSSSSTGGGPDCTNGQCVGGTVQGNCDSGLAIDSADAMDGARAIGLCQVAQNGSWGVKSATWVRADGSPLGMGDGGQQGNGDLSLGKGILSGFGPNVQVREGAKLLALSTGSARQPSDGASYHSVGGYWKDNGVHQAPTGFPKASTTCPGVTPGEPHDSAGLQVVIHTPNDAKSIAFDVDFYSYEFPNFVCSQYDDSFVAIMNPKPAALTDGNLTFDSNGDALSPHSQLLRVCTPAMAGGQNFACLLGPAQLTGTGFDEQVNGSAATGWLLTTAPIAQPGADITLLFSIWDSADGVEDSTVLVDDFKFVLTDATTVTVPN